MLVAFILATRGCTARVLIVITKYRVSEHSRRPLVHSCRDLYTENFYSSERLRVHSFLHEPARV